MQKILVSFLVGFAFLVVFSACDKDLLGEPCELNDPTPLGDCICTQEYDPVCGCDGVTYGNACTAACNGVPDSTPGECP